MKFNIYDKKSQRIVIAIIVGLLVLSMAIASLSALL